MRLERTDKEYGGGSGSEIFSSDLFRVVVWQLSLGTRTTITLKSCDFLELNFDGLQQFKTDDSCIEQLTSSELKQMISSIQDRAFEKGKMAKEKELRLCLGITPPILLG